MLVDCIVLAWVKKCMELHLICILGPVLLFYVHDWLACVVIRRNGIANICALWIAALHIFRSKAATEWVGSMQGLECRRTALSLACLVIKFDVIFPE